MYKFFLKLLLKIPFMRSLHLWYQNRVEARNERKRLESQRRKVNLKIDEVIDLIHTYTRTGSRSKQDPKLRATNKALDHYPQWDFIQTWDEILVLYPLIIYRTGGDYNVGVLTELLETEDSRSHLAWNIKLGFSGLRDWDWMKATPEISEEAIYDYLTTLTDRIDHYYSIEVLNSNKDEKIENQKELLENHFSRFNIIKCPSCSFRHVLSPDHEPYIQCSSCEEDLVYTPCRLDRILHEKHLTKEEVSDILSNIHEETQRIRSGEVIPTVIRKADRGNTAYTIEVVNKGKYS